MHICTYAHACIHADACTHAYMHMHACMHISSACDDARDGRTCRDLPRSRRPRAERADTGARHAYPRACAYGMALGQGGHAYVRACVYVCMHVDVCMYMYACMHMHACMHILCTLGRPICLQNYLLIINFQLMRCGLAMVSGVFVDFLTFSFSAVFGPL